MISRCHLAYVMSLSLNCLNVAATAHFAGVLLDAPFDDLVPLAERIVPSMLPAYFLPFTEVVLRRHYNLDVAAQLSGAIPVA